MSTAVHPFEPRRAMACHWPIERPYLAALKDLGLSDGTIACYFRVKPDEVAMLRSSYGIVERLKTVRDEPPKRRRFAWRLRA